VFVAAERRRRRVAVVTGQAGIGKTALCRRASEQAEAAGYQVVWGRCWPDGGAPSLWPWHGILSELIGDHASRLLAAEEDAAPADDAIQPERFGRFLAVADRLTEACADRPTMVVVDDVHYADPGALLLTRFLARAIDRVPLVIVLTRRPGPPDHDNPMLTDIESDAVTIALHGFDREETAEFLAAHGFGTPATHAVDALFRVTGGIPLHLSRAVASGASVTEEPGIDRAVDDALHGLSPAARRVVTLAAVLAGATDIDEVAELTGEPASAVVDALAEAAIVGLGELDATTPAFTFGHELVRQAVRATVPASAQLDIHALAGDRLRGDPRSERQVRRAHHTLAAAVRSQADARVAIEACRAAAHAMRRAFDYERAADLLGDAARHAERVSPPTERADVMVDWAEAVLACGRFGDARDIFDRTVAAAEAAGDPVLLARAAIAAGGFWLNQHRGTVDRQSILALQQRALDDLPPDEHALRARLTVRLAAAESVYHGAPVEPVLMALAIARRTGDPTALAEALSFTHHVLLPPEHAPSRLAIAEELIEVASAAGDGLHALLGLMWRTIDLYLMGDAAAERSLVELRERADALACRSVLYIVAAIDVMRLLRAGRLADAEAAAQSCYEMGVEAGDADAFAYYGAHLLTLRWLQGRHEELFDLTTEVADSPTLIPPEFTFRASVATIAAAAGSLDRARAELDGLLAPGLANLPRSSTWLSGMVLVVEAARVLGDNEAAGQAYELLRPFAELPVLPSFAVTCIGSVERSLGLAALTTGEIAAAVDHLERALEANRRLGNRPVTAVTRGELAEAFVARGGPSDISRAIRLLETAAVEAAAMGMQARASGWALQLSALREGEEAPPLRIRPHGRGWRIETANRQAVLPDLVGLRYLSILADRPGEDVTALELCGVAGLDPGDQMVLDDDAIAAYRARARELDGEITAAEADADLGRAERLRADRESLLAEVSNALGLGGRSRSFTSPSERARTAVRKAIKRAVTAVTAVDPEIGGQLGRSVSTGVVCRFDPTIGVTPTARRS
jgi:tetratricopeptide (TPR) repeat protein